MPVLIIVHFTLYTRGICFMSDSGNIFSVSVGSHRMWSLHLKLRSLPAIDSFVENSNKGTIASSVNNLRILKQSNGYASNRKFGVFEYFFNPAEKVFNKHPLYDSVKTWQMHSWLFLKHDPNSPSRDEEEFLQNFVITHMGWEEFYSCWSAMKWILAIQIAVVYTFLYISNQVCTICTKNTTEWIIQSPLILIRVLVCTQIIVISCTFLEINCIRIYVSASRYSV